MKKRIKFTLPHSIALSKLPSARHGRVLLTFDDGPHPELSNVIFDLLDQYDARAVFFVVGKFVERWPDQVRAARQRGHVVGNHSFSHPNGRAPHFQEYFRDIAHCQDLLDGVLGLRPELFRPPLGRMTISGMRASRRLGLTTVLWSNEGGEWGMYRDQSASQIGRRLIEEASPGDILLLHDNNTKVPEILRLMLPAFHDRGFDLRSGVDSILSATFHTSHEGRVITR